MNATQKSNGWRNNMLISPLPSPPVVFKFQHQGENFTMITAVLLWHHKVVIDTLVKPMKYDESPRFPSRVERHYRTATKLEFHILELGSLFSIPSAIE
jgi:hypothetical protein